MTVLYETYSLCLLLLLHIANYHISKRYIRPKLLPLLFTANDQNLAESINSNINIISQHEYRIPIPQSDTFDITNSRIEMIDIVLDIVISFSIQLVDLYLLDIVHLTPGFRITHVDWHITLTTLLAAFVYLIPSLVFYLWIFSSQSIGLNNSQQWTQWTSWVRWLMVLALWSLVVIMTINMTVLREIDGNIHQLGLYVLSLFGISCLSALNGIACLMACFEFYNWYNGIERNERDEKEFKAIELLRDIEYTGNAIGKLNTLDSLLRDVALLKLYESTIYIYIRFGSWLYCFYKIAYGCIRVIQLGLHFIVGSGSSGSSSYSSSNSEYGGNGDFLSITIAKIIMSLGMIKDTDDTMLERVIMVINLIISISFFFFSINNVLFTIKNLKALHNKRHLLNETSEFSFLHVLGYHWFDICRLLVVQISGVYVISTVLLLNTTSMPFHLIKFWITESEFKTGSLRSSVKNFVNADFINDWFDEWFGVGCLFAVLVLFLLKKSENMSGVTDYNIEYQKGSYSV